jgi:hypothetical protein
VLDRFEQRADDACNASGRDTEGGPPSMPPEQRRPGFAAGRLIVYDRESHLEVEDNDSLKVGDVLEVVRGNGPREGYRMGTATVPGFEGGSPVLTVCFAATGDSDET